MTGPLTLSWNRNLDPIALMGREWLVTNGLGGYASGTLLGVITRRHHGLFVPNLAHPKGRHILVSNYVEEVECQGQMVRLGGGEFVDGRLDTDAHLHLLDFSLNHGTAVWRFDIDGSIIEKTLTMPHYQNTVCINYRHGGGKPLHLKLRPFVSFRRHDADLVRDRRPVKLVIERGRYEFRAPGFDTSLRMGVHPESALFVAQDHDYVDLAYRVERDRGYDFLENSYSAGYFAVTLEPRSSVGFAATTHAWNSVDIDTEKMSGTERERIGRLISLAPAPLREPIASQLVAAADQFIVLPASRLHESAEGAAVGTEQRTVIAGYHWFGDWGRDTMISLEGLTLCTGRHREAGAILRTFANYVRDGLLPNLFPEGEREALYHTIDASLWYFHAIDRYHRITGDDTILTDLWPTLSSIVEHHIQGTLFGIGLDHEDGLIRGAAAGYQLTWMDAKVDGWVVTPRRGKPVEIQGLWYNALCLMADWARFLGQSGDGYARRADQARHSFNRRFWNAASGHLFDVIDGEGGDDPSGRPNQIFTLSLRHPILSEAHWKPVVDYAREFLLTPFGLRTLDPRHPYYKRNYHGDLRTRDAAYHQGTVWPWLIGHYIDAWLKVYPDRRAARELLGSFAEHLTDAGIGSISEIFDAEPPYYPRGCIAQAWSVAEVLRAWLNTSEHSHD